MAVLDRKEPVEYGSVSPLSISKAAPQELEGKASFIVDGNAGFEKGTRLLFKSQEDPKQNGVWEVITNLTLGGEGKVGGSGKIGEEGSWTVKRTADADTTEEVTDGMMVPVRHGEFNARTTWVQTTADPIEVGTDPLVFEELWATPGGKAGDFLEGMYPSPNRATGDLVLSPGDSITWEG